MGRGKTSAAAEYMRSCPRKRFLFITPYLSEVDRLCDTCGMDQPDEQEDEFSSSKLTQLKQMMHEGRNIASTHALFYRIDDDTIDIIKKKHYCLILDEDINVIKKVGITPKDRDNILKNFATEEEDGRVVWTDSEYTGRYSGYKDMAENGFLYHLDSAFLFLFRSDIFKAFDEVTMMTYMFDGQYQCAYLKYYGYDYEICGVDTSNGFRFTDKPDEPPALDYTNLIHIIEDEKMNSIGDDKFSLSKSWYAARNRDHADMKKLRRNFNRFFRSYSDDDASEVPASERIWTTFKEYKDKVLDSSRRYQKSYIQLNMRAKNEYGKRHYIAYLVNRFPDPNLMKFFTSREIDIDGDQFALSEMLQFIWRSAIRNGEEITIYIPSRRMRDLLKGWIADMARKSAETGDDDNG